MKNRARNPTLRIAKACFAFVALMASADAQDLGAIRVDLAEPPEGGQVRLLLFDSDVTFGRFSNPVRVAAFPAGRESYLLSDVAPGEYALVVHHDENSDGDFEKNFIGIPREAIAISRGYRPKGPPVYARASFAMGAGESRVFELELKPVLGKRGILGVGLGVIGRSSPYARGGAGVFQPIPAITFAGERLQWFGPSLRYSLLGSDRLRLAATANYRLRAYEEGDSPVLAGLGDRRDTLLAGLALVAELPAGVDVSLGYEHDVFDRIGGGTARFETRRSLQWGVARFTPKLGLAWSSSKLADHDFGVPAGKATAERPAYTVGDNLSFDLGVGSSIELSRSWRLVFDLGVEFLPDEVTNSPIVGDEHVIKGFFALAYAF